MDFTELNLSGVVASGLDFSALHFLGLDFSGLDFSRGDGSGLYLVWMRICLDSARLDCDAHVMLIGASENSCPKQNFSPNLPRTPICLENALL